MDQGETLFLFTTGLCADAKPVRKRNRLICEQKQAICPDFLKINSETEESMHIQE